MADSLTDRLKKGEVLIADGATGSVLMERGLKGGACPESLNLSRPEVLVDVAREYLQAGSDLIQTNTFGASPLKLANYGLEKETEKINRRAVQAVREAVGARAFVSASCGPTGKILKPYGDTEAETVYRGYLAQLGSLLQEGVDVICIETMTDIEEALLALRAARELSSEIPVMVTLTFEKTSRGFFTIMGNDIATVCQPLLEAGADIIGSNCGNGSDTMVEIAAEFRKHSDAPVLIQPNAGLPEMKNGRLAYPETPEYMAAKAVELKSNGVSIIGACCGSTPDHIRAISAAVKGAA